MLLCLPSVGYPPARKVGDSAARGRQRPAAQVPPLLRGSCARSTGPRLLRQGAGGGGRPLPPAPPWELPRKVKLLVKGACRPQLRPAAAGRAGPAGPRPPCSGRQATACPAPPGARDRAEVRGPEGTGGALEHKPEKSISPAGRELRSSGGARGRGLPPLPARPHRSTPTRVKLCSNETV